VRPSHHPRDETLLSLAAGRLGVGPQLVVATHLSGCAQCRGQVRAFEAIGGALLAEPAFEDRASSLLAGALSRLEAPPAAVAPPRRRAAGLAEPPAPLSRCDIGPWRFIQPGLHISRVTIPGEARADALLLKFGAGARAPRHGHDGTEYTQVLAGVFTDAIGRYQPGDCIEADEDVDHIPTVEGDAECICLAAVDGRLRLHSFLGRLLQPLLGL
jgi:putative transcriptional regulator